MIKRWTEWLASAPTTYDLKIDTLDLKIYVYNSCAEIDINKQLHLCN